MSYLLVLHGTPRPMKTHRDGRGGRKYDPLSSYKKLALAQLQQQCATIGKVFDCPIRLDVIFEFAPPRSTTKKKSDKMISGEIKHSVRPDIDNTIKVLLDILKKCIIKDDALVYSLQVKKRYSYDPKTIIILTPDEDACNSSE